MNFYDVSFSIVLYNSDPIEVEALLKCISEVSLKYYIYVIDNSKSDIIKCIIEKFNNVKYHHTKYNIGYGKAHNIAIEYIAPYSKYHIVLNPDIIFEKGTVESLYMYMEGNPEVGQVMPKILYGDGRVQRLCKLLPRPSDLFIRRFLKPLGLNINLKYELNDFNYDRILEFPSLSGCFMFLRSKILIKVNGFDPIFFLYLEDFDLTRRIHQISKTVFYPYASAIHRFNKASYNNPKMLKIHVLSAIKYFNKWGWFNDDDRDLQNKATLNFLDNA
ncbi:MAG TPA: glycosyltransferase family 2 protein [Flavipsychrobacter sp.]|nr:glycosyltransferase family 2 protein [Flavipsychrobacter sp.]